MELHPHDVGRRHGDVHPEPLLPARAVPEGVAEEAVHPVHGRDLLDAGAAARVAGAAGPHTAPHGGGLPVGQLSEQLLECV